MAIRTGRFTITLPSRPVVQGFAAVAGKKEGEGPLAAEFDHIFDDTTLGEVSWEKAESKLHREAVIRALSKAQKSPADVDVIFAGDLLSQCIGTCFGIRELDMPFAGLYGACSTMALSLLMASVFIDTGTAGLAVASTSSHFCSAEKQFRLPLEYGGQRPPSAQWTATAAGAAVLASSGEGPRVESVIIGKMQDLGIKDANNMGAAMAPAAADTIVRYLKATQTAPEQYDAIVTGDLGIVGSELLCDLVMKQGFDITRNHKDCGAMLYDPETQDTHAGGSGCGCSASLLCGHFLPALQAGTMRQILFAATGALMSPTASQQGESIPGISHLVELTRMYR